MIDFQQLAAVGVKEAKVFKQEIDDMVSGARENTNAMTVKRREVQKWSSILNALRVRLPSIPEDERDEAYERYEITVGILKEKLIEMDLLSVEVDKEMEDFEALFKYLSIFK